jgi:serine/threonine protein kinase/tetratricopeptide (TPR) repeat protein
MIKEPDIVLGEIIDNYEIVEVGVARGRFGVIHKVKRGGEAVALKFLLGDPSSSEYQNQAKLFKREYQRLTELSHPHISKALGFGFYKGFLYLASEFIENAATFYNGTCGLSIDEMVPLFIQILEGLDYIHRNGFVHLDIKSENILLTKTAGKQIAKIIDFGIITLIEEMKQGGLKGGTFPYIAPEVALDEMRNEINGHADLFSLAVLMYYCIVSRFPYERSRAHGDFNKLAEIIKKEKPPKSPSKLFLKCPPYLETIMMRLLNKDPGKRFYPNARAVINALLTNQPDAFGAPEITASYLRPIGDKHIGRADIQQKLNTILQYPNNAIFHIIGGHGTGKTHLLSKLKENAVLQPEKMQVCSISFPADEAMLERWAFDIQSGLSENNRSVLILFDDIDNCPEETINRFVRPHINSVIERKTQSMLHDGLKPLIVIFSSESSFRMMRGDAIDDYIIRLELCPFTMEEVLEYLKSTPALKDKPIPAKWVDWLYEASSGIPLELVARLEKIDADKRLIGLYGLEGDIILPAVDEPSVDFGAKFDKAPPPTEERLAAQYHSFNYLEREVLNLMAVWNHKHVSREIEQQDIANFFYTPAIGQTVSNLIKNGTLAYKYGTSKLLAFAKPCMQSVIYNKISQGNREIVHDSVASYLKSDYEGILLHQGYGSDKHKAVTSLAKLVQKRIREKGDLRLAIELLQDALSRCHSDPERAPRLQSYILTLLIECYVNAGKYAEMENLFNDAMHLTEKTFFAGMRTWKAQLYRRVIPALIQQHKFKKAEAMIVEAGGLIKFLNTPSALVIENYRGRNLYEQFFVEGSDKKISKSTELLNEAMKIFEKTARLEEKLPQENRSRIYNNELGNVLLALGKYDKAIRVMQNDILKYRKEKNILKEIAADIAIADSCRCLKDYKGAREFADNALKLAKGANIGKWMLHVRRVLIDILHDESLGEEGRKMKKYKEAIAEGNRFLAASSCLSDAKERLFNTTRLWAQLGNCYLVGNEYDKARLYFESAIKSNVSGHYLMWAQLGLGEVCYKSGDYNDAILHLSEAEKLLDASAEFSAPYLKRISEFKMDINEKLLEPSAKKSRN